MKVLVGIKRVVDAYVRVRVKSDGTGVDLTNAKMAINPFCEIAVEEAIRLKEAGAADEVIAVSIGPATVQEQIRTALALGSDRGILVQTEEALEPLAVAKVLKAIVEKEGIDLVILGKQSIDTDNNQVGQMLAALLNVPQGTFACKAEVKDGKIEVTREIDGGEQTVMLDLPAVVTTDLRLNEPRYASLPNIMKAKKKPIDTLSAADLGVEVGSNIKTLSVAPPAERSAGVKVESVAALVDKLKNEAKVI
jgi:electron transfer flavoprotein beta subunit